MPTETTEKPKLNYYPFWAPRFWHGMLLRSWLRLVFGGGFRVHPLRVPMVLIVAGMAAINSALHSVQQLFHGRAIAATTIDEPPVFIVGHWRSGTTFLHELLACDERFAFPTTYECFAPNHFVVTSRVLPTPPRRIPVSPAGSVSPW